MKEKIKDIVVAGICSNCNNRRSCDFVMNIKPCIMNNKYADRIIDIEIAVYSCDNYESDVDKICNESDMCISCCNDE